MSNFVFQFYHPDGKGGIRPLVAAAGNDIKEAFVAASRKAISLYGRPGGVLGVVHTSEDAVSKTEEEVKRIFNAGVPHSLGFNVTSDLLDKINEPIPVSDQAPAAPPAPAATAPAAPAAPKAPRGKRGGNASLPKPVTADSVIEDDPEKEESKSRYESLIQSVVNKYIGVPLSDTFRETVSSELTSLLISNCPGIENLNITINEQEFSVTSSLGTFNLKTAPAQ